MYEVFGYVLVLAGLVALTAVASRGLQPALRRVLWLSFWLRVAGSLARYLVLVGPYKSGGDATAYFAYGQYISDAMWSFDLEGVDNYLTGRDGTVFVRVVSAVVLSIIGPTMVGEFLVFSMFSMLGLWLMILAVEHESGTDTARRYALIVSVSPSLCYWPCSVGKDALVILALGLVMRGYVGARGRPRWLLLSSGLLLCAATRPHIAALAAVGLVVAEVVSSEGHMLAGQRAPKLFLLGVAAAYLIAEMGESFSIDPTSLEDVEAFLDFAAGQTMQGGSQIEASSGFARFGMAFVNVLFRPFLWEAHNLGALLASIELVVLWIFVLRDRRAFRDGLRGFRRDRALRFALACGLLLAVALGATFFNMGILARQRVAPLALLLTAVWRTPTPRAPQEHLQ